MVCYVDFVCWFIYTQKSIMTHKRIYVTYTLLGGADTVFFPLLSHKGHDYFNGTTLRDYRLNNSSCFYDYYINALSVPSKNGITPIKVTPSSFIHGCVLPSIITILRKESRILRNENVSCSIFSFVSTFNAD